MTWVPMNDLARALEAEREVLRAAVDDVLGSGWLIQGPQHTAFEAELAAFLGTGHVAGVASGTDALEIALRALMPTGRTTVVTAANCGGYTTTAARRAGFGVRFADVDPATLCIDPEDVSRVLDESVGVVVVTHLYGRSADVEAVRDLCRPLGVMVLEDCAQALGAHVGTARVGSLGHAAAFSFYPTKNLGALGDGGAIASSDPTVIDTVLALRQYGWRGKYTIGVDGGRNSRLDEVQAAVLRRRLPRLDAWNERRRAIITSYVGAAPERVRVLAAEGPEHVAHLAVALCDERDALRAHLAEHRVRTDVHYPVPDHRQPALAAQYADVHLPATERAVEQIVSLPVFPELRDDEIERVCDALASF